MTLRGTISEEINAPAPAVFGFITDIDRLPEWNDVITRVVERPEVLSEGAEWMVELHAMASSWRSRSRLLEHDEGALRFAYRASTDDDNPSYANWTWTVDAVGVQTSRVTVDWEIHAKTFVRRVLLARIRNRQLRSEVRQSLRSLERILSARAEAH